MNYYDILECVQNATYDEIKDNYKKLVKLVHPDKTPNKCGDKFLLIDQAWKVLRDEKLRKEYDATLVEDNINHQHLIYAELTEKELNFDSISSIATYQCRCGLDFRIEKADLSDGDDLVIECEECSNCLLIKCGSK